MSVASLYKTQLTNVKEHSKDPTVIQYPTITTEEHKYK